MKSMKDQLLSMLIFLTSKDTIFSISEYSPEVVDGQFYGYSLALNIDPSNVNKIVKIFDFLGQFSVNYSVTTSLLENGTIEYIQIVLKEPDKNRELKNFLDDFIKI
ncbi:hypothetical protein [Companilactobacillus insicii]|uniref:hypothetical protein n=1 Tax=Companilactobacillus insicii TaxID=1732567 RepID=UPI000F7B1C12|nr:hypothetical protein [Companilactobacillus insicii]